MNFKKICLLLAFLPFAALAQNCGYSINYGKWFSAQANINSLSWNPVDGSKLAVHQSVGAFAGNSSAYPVLDMGPDSVTRNALLTKAYTNGGTTANVVYASTGGIFMNNYYITPTGTQVAVPGTSTTVTMYSVARSADRDTVVYVYNYKLGYANVSDPENPVFTNISTIVGITNTSDGLPGSMEAIATQGNRIYIATKNIAYTDDPVVIKCRDFAGQPCPNFADVAISTGSVYDIEVRPTDSMVFIRGDFKNFGSQGSQFAQPGMVILNPNGSLATGFNHTDLSIISPGLNYPNGSGKRLVRFDSDGNIFANMPLLSGGTYHGIGIYKFDPKGNVDLDFMRNVANSYLVPGVTKVSYFDVNQVTGEVAIGLDQNDANELGEIHALAGGEHKHGNNQDWYTNFQSIGIGDGASTNGSRGNSGYNCVHILYNNGKLKVQGESAASQASNCGTSTPSVIPYKDPAVGNIQCDGLSFIAAPVAGTPSTLVVKVPVNVTAPGVFKPVTVSGSGMSMQDPYTTFTASAVGINDFYLTLKYDGSALGTFNISVNGAGSCSANLADQTKNNPSVVPIWTPENCTYKVIGPDLK